MALPRRANAAPTFDMFVGNFPASRAGDADTILREQFSRCGPIDSVEVRLGNRGDGHFVGFVRFLTEEARNRAIDITQAGVVIDDLKLFASLPRPSVAKGAAVGKVHVSDGNSKPSDSVVTMPMPIGEGDILVTHIESICYFWGQTASNESAEAIAAMTVELSTIPMSPAVGGLKEDQLYAAQFAGDMCWYRCKLIRQVSADKSEVVYVDYGNTEVISSSSAMDLPKKFAVLAPFATRYWLLGFQAAPVPPARLEEGMKMMETLKDTIVTCQFYPPCPSMPNVVPIRAISNGGEIGPCLNQSGYVVELPTEKLRSLYSRPTPAVTPVAQPSSSNSVVPTEHVTGLSETASPKQHANQTNGRPMRLNPPPAQNSSDTRNRSKDRLVTTSGNVTKVTALLPDPVPSGAGDSNPRSQVVVQVKDPKLISENVDLRRELNRMKQDNFIWQQKQKTLTDLQHNHEELKKQLANMKKNSLMIKMETLVKDITTVSVLRAQFPSKIGMKDCIEGAYELVADEASRLLLVNFPTLAEINTIRSSYQAAQAAVLALKDNVDIDSETLAGLIASRDESRLVLYHRLEDFLSASRELPLTEKGKQMEVTLSALKTTYKDYLVPSKSSDRSDLFQIMSEYSSWKAKKVQLFEDTRLRTDQYRREAASAMNQMRKLLISSDLEEKSLPDLDKVISLCHTAVEVELKVTNEAQDAEEKARISYAVKTLVRELERELLDINQISESYSDYAELCVALRMWLTEKPDVDELHACMKRIKLLKSKLRHLLADRVDAQEGVGSSTEELNIIDKDLMELREQLQNEFATEDLLLNHITRLATEHFPELFMQYPEFSLGMNVEYGGLLKRGRMLDQFDLSRLYPNNANIHKSVVCGKPVVLKEFVLGDHIGVKKEDFLRRVVVFSKVGDSILQPEGIFFDQAERLVVVQLPYMQHNLTTFVESMKLTHEATYGILIGVLLGLESLHRANLVHGAVHPNNVLIAESGNGVLADYDFSKIPLHRAERKFTTSSGIQFIAPEVSTSAITCASDMFNLGLLILWMHHPNRKFLLGQSNIPNIAAVELPNGLLAIVKTLLQAASTRRPTATQLLREQYFLVPPVGYNSFIGNSGDLPSKITDLDDESPSSDPDEFEDNLLGNKNESSKIAIDCSSNSKSGMGSNPAVEGQIGDVLAELSIVDDMHLANEWSDELTSSSNDNNGAAGS